MIPNQIPGLILITVFAFGSPILAQSPEGAPTLQIINGSSDVADIIWVKI